MSDTKRGVCWTVAGLLLFVALVLMFFVRSLMQPRPLYEQDLRSNGFLLERPPRSVPAPEGLRERLSGHWTLVTLGYTRCVDGCPNQLAMLATMKRNLAGTAFATDTQVLVLGIDPEADSDAHLRGYVEAFDPSFLVHRVTRDAGREWAHELGLWYSAGAPGSPPMARSEQVVLLDPQQRVHGAFVPPFESGRFQLTYKGIRAAEP